jgi:hypothetical protein
LPEFTWESVQKLISETYKQKNNNEGPNLIAAGSLTCNLEDTFEVGALVNSIKNFFRLATIWNEKEVTQRFKLLDQYPSFFYNFWLTAICYTKPAPYYSQIWQLVFDFLPVYWKNVPQFISGF